MPAEDDGNWIVHTVRGLARVPAYLLVFALAVAPGFTGAEPAVTVSAFAAAVGVVALVESGSRRLERQKARLEDQHEHVLALNRRAIPAASEEQARRLSRLDLPERELATREVLDGIVDNDQDLCLVYSSTRVERYIAQDGRPIDFDFTEPERQVTAIPDAHGVSYLHGLLALAGKRDRIRVMTAADFDPSCWDLQVVLIGSPNANLRTGVALKAFGCPYRFTAGVGAIERWPPVPGETWPARPGEFAGTDYAIIAKLVRRTAAGERGCLVLAGIGGIGTLSACYFLQREIVGLRRRFGDAPFAGVLRVDREVGYTSVAEAEPIQRLEVVTSRDDLQHS